MDQGTTFLIRTAHMVTPITGNGCGRSNWITGAPGGSSTCARRPSIPFPSILKGLHARVRPEMLSCGHRAAD